MSEGRGLYEWPESGAITAGTSEGTYLCLPSNDVLQVSSTYPKAMRLVIRLSYLGLEAGMVAFLKRRGSRGGLRLELVSVTSMLGACYCLSCCVCC